MLTCCCKYFKSCVLCINLYATFKLSYSLYLKVEKTWFTQICEEKINTNVDEVRTSMCQTLQFQRWPPSYCTNSRFKLLFSSESWQVKYHMDGPLQYQWWGCIWFNRCHTRVFTFVFLWVTVKEFIFIGRQHDGSWSGQLLLWLHFLKKLFSFFPVFVMKVNSTSLLSTF